MLAHRFHSVLIFMRALLISLLVGICMAPMAQAQSGNAKAIAPGIPTQAAPSKTYTVSIQPDNSTTLPAQAQPGMSASQVTGLTPARPIQPPDDPEPPASYNYAQALGQSVPTQMEAGRMYAVSVTMYNTGTTTWSRAEAYSLVSYAPLNGTTWGFNRVALPSDYVAPGQSATFTFQVTAPGTPGAYTFQWGMQREGYGNFGTTTAAVTVNVIAPALVSNAQVAGQSVPTQMQAGKPYNVSVTMVNSGTTTWTRAEQYSLMTQSPGNNTTWGFNRVSLPFDNVAPGQTVTFAFSVTAPATPGQYTSQWSMQREGYGAFGAFTGALTVKVVPAPANLGNVTFIHTDGLGSPVARTDGAGNLISRTYYEPYGNVAAGAQPTIGFTGHVNDVDTGLTYMQQRYYDPVAGRFLSIDPVTTDANTGGSFNRYAYANNSPYRYVDPDGRFAFLLPLVPYLVDATVVIVGHYVLPGRQGREDTARAVGNAILNGGSGDKGNTNQASGTKVDGQRPTKTPNEGAPGSTYINPGSGQERKYGSDGKPVQDIDHDHDHGQGVPHIHDWGRDANGRPVRGPGRPVDPKPVPKPEPKPKPDESK